MVSGTMAGSVTNLFPVVEPISFPGTPPGPLHVSLLARMDPASNEAQVRRAIEAIWNRGGLDAADDLFAPDYVNHQGVIADLVIGPEAIKICAASHRAAFPNLWVVVEDAGAVEDVVVFGWSAGSGLVASPSFRGITRARLVDGKIAESWTEWDRIDD